MEDAGKEIDLKTSNRVSPEQRELMISFMELHPALATNAFMGIKGASTRIKLWQELSEILNSCPTGGKKEPDRWIKCWQDWKSETNLKFNKIMAYSEDATPPMKRPLLRSLEERLLSVIGKIAVLGNDLEDPLQCKSEEENISEVDDQSNTAPRESTENPRGQKRKHDEENSDCIEERLAKAAEGHSAAMQQMANKLDEVGDAFIRLTEECIKFLRRH
ncbi:uncharacterized protein LOC124165945 [Ischnura elegans]|uniref:uncharacterized protein LOC124165945 n=1 Tax=Ischnura elegans TaxID=197161 RepID=UPI001ED893B3|nr:uncharacterized protein LOC124165945 [Ischnura elegans]